MLCFARVKEMDTGEISLLFKSLVILPEDKTIEDSPEELVVARKENPNPSKLEEIKLEKSDNKTIPTEKTVAILPLAAETALPEESITKVEEPKSEYIQHPLIIIISPALKKAYLAPDSNFHKTIGALNSPQLAKYISTDSKILKNATQYTCIWCIGLDIKIEKEALNTSHPNLLCSPDFNSLTTTEEKKAMFGPLKEFVGTNLELISKL